MNDRIKIDTRVIHPEDDKQLGTVIEIGEVTTATSRARVKWDDVNYGNNHIRKGKRTWIAFSRLKLAPT